MVYLQLHNMCRLLGTQGDYGPFEPNRAVEVPAWLALQLHKRNKARILVPSWLTCESLDGECLQLGGFMTVWLLPSICDAPPLQAWQLAVTASWTLSHWWCADD